MLFDIKDFNFPISKKLFDVAIKFAQQQVRIKREDFNIIQHTRKSLLCKKEVPRQKKNTNLFDVAIGAYDRAEVYELVGFFYIT